MALIHLDPTPAHVAWDHRRARPAAVAWGGRRLRVTGVAARRDELSAFRPERGPRITYLLDTEAGQASLVFDARRRAWYVEALEAA